MEPYLSGAIRRTGGTGDRLAGEVAVFARLMDPSGPFWRTMGTIADMIVLNLLTILTVIPVVTAGAGLTALYDSARRILDGTDTGAARTFLRSFRSNFAKAGALWAIVGPVGLGIAALWLFVVAPELAVLKTLISLVYLLVFPFVWAMQARFENTVWRTLLNAVVMAVARLPYSGGALIIHIVMIALVALTWMQLPWALFFLLLLGYPLAVFGSTPLIERALAPLIPAEDDEAAEAADAGGADTGA
ncbi:beta-carotene 15,15'-monooxygenase [Microbacterium thalassium]|nr:beta-carotene 15,15'-monooxygenase [Microbacterium thalassium]